MSARETMLEEAERTLGRKLDLMEKAILNFGYAQGVLSALSWQKALNEGESK